MKAVLKYVDNPYTRDGNTVVSTLASEGVEIVKTKYDCNDNKVTICINDMNELNNLLVILNRLCVNEVSVVKVYHENVLATTLKKLFKQR